MRRLEEASKSDAKKKAKKKASTRRLGGILGRPDGFGEAGWGGGSHGGRRISGPLIEVNRGTRGT